MAESSAKYRYFFLSFCVSFLVLSLLFLLMMFTIHPNASSGVTKTSVVEQDTLEQYTPQKRDALTVLFMGTAAGKQVAHTYILVRFDPESGTVPVIVLPPQTLVRNLNKTETLQQVFEYAGAANVVNALQTTLGIPIDRYVRIGEDSFVLGANAIGTVEYTLAQETILNQGGMKITLKKGLQLLDGKKVYSLITHPDYDGGELERCDVTAKLTCEIINQRRDICLSTVVDKIFEKLVNIIDTNISYPDYYNRKLAAQYMAESAKQPAYAMQISGSFNADDTKYTLSDTFIAKLSQIFL